MSNRQPVQSAAFAVAMSARTNGLTQQRVDAMRGTAEDLLENGDPLRLACLHFVKMFATYRRDPDAMRRFGEELDRAVQTDLHPERQAQHERRDIDG